MSDFYKYYREEHLQFIDMYKSYYCISTNNECSVIQTLLTYYKKDNCYNLLISQSFNFDPKTSNYTPKKQTIFFMSRYALNMKLRNEDYYIREYSDILQAFNDPIFKNYVDVLNEI